MFIKHQPDRYFSRHSQKIADAISKPNKEYRRLAANAELLTEFISVPTLSGKGHAKRISRVTVRLHRTDIATINALTGEVQVKHGGWITPTTRTWIESALEVLTGSGKASNAGGTMEWWAGPSGLHGTVTINKDWTTIKTRVGQIGRADWSEYYYDASTLRFGL